MDNTDTINRRAAIIGTAVSVAALAAPVAAAVKPTTIEALAEQIRDDAAALDPRIGEFWVGYDELADGPREMRVMSVYFGRSSSRFLAPATGAKQPTITSLFSQWQAERKVSSEETEEHAEARYARYVALQRRITAMRPRTVQEVAMQFVVETDDGDSEYRPSFYRRLRHMAMEG